MALINFIAIAAEADCDVKTARDFFKSEMRARQKPATRRRLTKALRALGIADPLAPQAA